MAVRCLHEASLHEGSSFVTLTYSPEKLQSWSLRYKDFQDFMKRLRFHMGPTRFFMCGEYGEENFRPHFHALLFGREFPDRKHLQKLSTGDICTRASSSRICGRMVLRHWRRQYEFGAVRCAVRAEVFGS